MGRRDGYIEGVPCWVDTNHPDPEAAVDFYRGVFGWEFEDVMPPESEGNYFVARINGGEAAAVGSNPPGAPPGARWNTYIQVDDADAAVRRARDAGGRVAMEAFDVMDAGRMAVIADPEGATFCLWQPKNHKGATIVNEHGALNFNGLATRDPKAAEAFYGAVFGWKLLPLADSLAWALPGYGDHLEEATPGIKARMEEMGAPGGFIDVVAALDPIPEDDTDTTAHWNVTFGVDNVEMVVHKAYHRDAKIVAQPFDAPWSRLAVIKDPQGATFIVSQFVPESPGSAVTGPA